MGKKRKATRNVNIKAVETDDFDSFNSERYNRKINTNVVRKIIANMVRDGYWPDEPITVVKNGKSGRWVIIDGHHRFIAARTLGIKFRYRIIEEPDVVGFIARRGGAVSTWTLNDMILLRARMGDKNYMAIEKYANDNGISLQVAAAIMLDLLCTLGHLRSDVYNGDFRPLGSQMQRDVSGVLKVARAVRGDSFACRSSFVRAIVAACAVSTVDLSRLKKKIRARGGNMLKVDGFKANMKVLEDVYNHNHKGRLLALEADYTEVARGRRGNMPTSEMDRYK